MTESSTTTTAGRDPRLTIPIRVNVAKLTHLLDAMVEAEEVEEGERDITLSVMRRVAARQQR